MINVQNKYSISASDSNYSLAKPVCHGGVNKGLHADPRNQRHVARLHWRLVVQPDAAVHAYRGR